MGVGRTAGSLPNSKVGGVSVLEEVWAGDSPLPRFWLFALGLASAQNLSYGLTVVRRTGWRLGGEAGRHASGSSLSERSSERVELQSDTDDRDSRVEEGGSEGAEGFSGLSRRNSLRVGGLVLRLWPPVLWKKPSHLDLTLSSGWERVSRLQPSPTAASRAPQPSRTSSERRPPPGLFRHGGVPGTCRLAQYSSPSPSAAAAGAAAVFPSFWKGMQR
ncbi:hypothetical protein EYF80_043307 [Liparis tanakae]|uniref:Uncharacterized protein n=1 Tax=Liparis tanakae TaxID=230148 RepID=A0A4Z2FZ22_9TELE|nr:hypothetical protein EYF80_043307 [Liparis tanakae]